MVYKERLNFFNQCRSLVFQLLLFLIIPWLFLSCIRNNSFLLVSENSCIRNGRFLPCCSLFQKVNQLTFLIFTEMSPSRSLYSVPYTRKCVYLFCGQDWSSQSMLYSSYIYYNYSIQWTRLKFTKCPLLFLLSYKFSL